MASSIDRVTESNCFFGKYEVPNSGLSDELILEIFRFLDVKSLGASARSCKKLYCLSQDTQLWKYLCIRDFFHVQSINKENNWKKFYQTCMGMDYLNIPLPGTQGVFHTNPKENWKPYYSSTLLQRKLNFINEKSDCIFSKFSLLGYEDGRIAISITFSKNKYESLRVYLKSIDPSGRLLRSLLEPTDAQINGSINIWDLDLIKKIFRVISAFNTLPKEELAFMRKIIWAENWKNITPLSEKDIQDIDSGRAAYEKAHKPSFLGWLVGKILGLDRLRL